MPQQNESRLSGTPNLLELTHEISGERWLDFRKRVSPKYTRIWSDILLNYIMLFVGVLPFYLLNKYAVFYINWVSIPIGAFWMSFWLHSNSAFFHEAAHCNLMKNRKINDIIANMLFMPIIGLDVVSYRRSHWQHHLYLGTTKDTEISYFQPLSVNTLLLKLSGLYLVKKIYQYGKVYASIDNKRTNVNSSSRFIISLIIAGIAQTIILLGLFIYISLYAALAWLLAYFIMTPALNSIRQTLEHRSVDANPEINYSLVNHTPVNKIFSTSFLSRKFGNAGFNRHLLHHWDPSMSYTNFDEMENFLMHTPLKNIIKQKRTTYIKEFGKLFSW